MLDGLLVEAATAAGAELIDRFTVDDVVWSEGRATGVVGHLAQDQQITLRSKVVVGADGRHSKIGRLVGAQVYEQHGVKTGVRYSYWSGLQHLGASFHARHGHLVLVWPTNDRLTCIYVGTTVDEFRSTQHNVEPHFLDSLSLVPGLRDAVTTGERTHRFVGTDDLPNGYRCSAGPGWALVGDAGHQKDPSTGMGMADAFTAAEVLAGAIHDGLIGITPMDAAVASYQCQRGHVTLDGLQLDIRWAATGAQHSPHVATIAEARSVLFPSGRRSRTERTRLRSTRRHVACHRRFHFAEPRRVLTTQRRISSPSLPSRVRGLYEPLCKWLSLEGPRQVAGSRKGSDHGFETEFCCVG